jgi:hypothetical protein
MFNIFCAQPPAGEAGLLLIAAGGRVVQSHHGVQKFLVEQDGGGASGVGGDALVVTGNHAARSGARYRPHPSQESRREEASLDQVQAGVHKK